MARKQATSHGIRVKRPSETLKITVKNFFTFSWFVTMSAVFIFQTWGQVDKFLKRQVQKILLVHLPGPYLFILFMFDKYLQVGQTIESHTPEMTRFPTTVVCHENAFDRSKLGNYGLPEDLFDGISYGTKKGFQEFPDLNQTWNDVTMSVINILAIPSRWNGSENGGMVLQIPVANNIFFSC